MVIVPEAWSATAVPGVRPEAATATAHATAAPHRTVPGAPGDPCRPAAGACPDAPGPATGTSPEARGRAACTPPGVPGPVPGGAPDTAPAAGAPQPAGAVPPGLPATAAGRARGARGTPGPYTGDLRRDPGPAFRDPLHHPDPSVAADAAAVENLLRCWVRETGAPRPDGGWLRIVPAAGGPALRAPVRYWSATGWHRFGHPVVEGGPEQAPPVDAVTLAALLGREARYAVAPAGVPGAHGGHAGGDGRRPTAPGTAAVADLVGRVAESVCRTAVFLAARRTGRPAEGEPSRFLDGEQALLWGHPLHPAPKSREGFTEAEALRYSPESYGSFPLHWFAVARPVLASDSAWTRRGRAVSAEQLVRSLAGQVPPGLPDGAVPLPLHPWQAREIRHRPEVAALFDAGLLTDLGPAGPRWCPTSSLRTVYRPAAPAMLKLSLAVRITNSRRENLRKELNRGVEVHRLLRTGLHGEWQAACPAGSGSSGGCFDIVRDPAWLAVDAPDGTPVTGLDVVIRHNPFGAADDALCLAGLTAVRPGPEPGSTLARVVARLAAGTGRTPHTVATEWFLRYLHTVVRPVLWLDGAAGVALEAHQQNTVVLLDRAGWPVGGRYRDNQGYYFRASHRAALDRRLPGIGEHSDTFVEDEVADERFAYYLGINNVLGLIGAFGSQRLADEGVLLAAFRRFLARAAAEPAGTRSTLPARLLDSPTLRCKANLLTRLHGLDELVGPVESQSVYVTIGNPVARSG
ncbi:IucA/IucC family protein [Streptomyces pactum]|uniref:IucA/IucC family protein n=1 Tax=Streptomyces pactum TaxID=68249 RepID=UPI0036FEB744